MTGIRPLRSADLAEVCALYERVMRSGGDHPPPGLEGYFSRIFLDHPWVDPEIPSLVYEGSNGRITGFVGSNPRRMRLDGRSVRLACSSNLVAHPDSRGAGAMLMKRYMDGPQDITITDGATDEMRRIWTGLRGQTLLHASIDWVRILRPAAFVPSVLERRGVMPHARRAAGIAVPVVDAVARRLPRIGRSLSVSDPGLTAEELSVDVLLEQVELAARSLRLRPDYDSAYLHWLFNELDAVDLRGEPVRHLVRDARGRVVGWYVYFRCRGGVADVLQIASPGGRADQVLHHLLWDAERAGVAAVRGRVEPALAGVLGSKRCLLVPLLWALVHSNDATMLALLGSAASLLTRLDGDAWMGHRILWRNW